MVEKIRPNFFIIGAPKSGTTAMSEYLRLHPNCFFSDPKEPEYFAIDFRRRIIQSENDYFRLFQKADLARHFAIGEGSVVYMFSKVAIRNILQFQPKAKFIIMLRNPVDMVVSLHAQLLRNGTESIPTFLEAWNAESERRRGRKIPISCRDPQWYYYSEWGKLGTHLKRIMNIIPSNKLKIILFDDFIQDTRTIYVDVLEYLNLTDDGRMQFPKINKRLRPKSLVFQNLIALLMRLWLPIRNKLTLGRGFGLGDYLIKKNSSEGNTNLSPEVMQKLLSFYQDEIFLLEKLINRKIDHWWEIE